MRTTKSAQHAAYQITARSAAERVADDGLQALDEIRRARPVEPKRAPTALLERGEVPERLRGDERAERFVPAGNRQVTLRIGGELEEDAARRPALVELPGRVEEARPEAEGGGDAERVAAMALQAYQEGASPLPNVLQARRDARDLLAQSVEDLALAWNATAALRVASLTTARPSP